MSLPSNAKARKNIPLYSGLLRYFPDALRVIAAKAPDVVRDVSFRAAIADRLVRSSPPLEEIASLALTMLQREIVPGSCGAPTAADRRDRTIDRLFRRVPDALAAVADLSRIGNEQHNPGTPLHWDRSKSGDELDALTRHLFEAGTVDTDGVQHSTKVAWRALAALQKQCEAMADAARRALADAPASGGLSWDAIQIDWAHDPEPVRSDRTISYLPGVVTAEVTALELDAPDEIVWKGRDGTRDFTVVRTRLK